MENSFDYLCAGIDQMILKRNFYKGSDVVSIAQQLLGKELVTCFDGKRTSGLIAETEAYAGEADRASHAFGGRRTARTETMYAVGGTAYVYLCYGMHSLFNVVTNAKDVPHAVLIRGVIPKDGISTMLERTGKRSVGKEFGIGPGRVAKALGIHFSHSGLDLLGEQIWIEDNGIRVSKKDIKAGPRVGVDYAGRDAKLPYRFIWYRLTTNVQ
jgi:DNA-3-methyladenine glycosylase